MNKLRNRVQLIGRLGAKADVKHLENGKCVANFSIATNEVYYNAKSEKVEETTWHQVVAWNKHAETIEKYTDKGSELAVDGKIVNKNYTDKDGIKRYVTEIHIDEILLLGEKVASV